MLSFFRNFTKSRVGVIIVFIVLGVIALAFAMGDVTGLSQAGAGGGKGATIATIGKTKLSESEVRDRIDRLIANARRQGQNVDINAFLNSGDFESVIDELINNAALVEFAQSNDMAVSKALVDGEIASIPAFQGPDGKFDQARFDNILREQRLSIAMFREDFQRSRYGAWLVNPIVATAQVPTSLVAPYASLFLERRKGAVGVVRFTDMPAPADPDAKALTDYYARSRARYTVPERRTIRYALVKAADLQARSAATDAEIQEAYAKAGTRFAAREKRSAHQLVLLDQATANKVAADAKAGKSLADQAKAMGLEAAKFDGLEKAEFARQTSDAIANAAFAAPQGGVIGPVRSPLGWVVVTVDKVEKIAARSLAEARAELAAEVSQKKAITALMAFRQKIEDGIGGGATFDELIKDNALTAASIGPVAANGTNPLDPASKPDPALAPVIQSGFAVQPSDDVQLAATAQDGSFAVVAPQSVVPAAPRPLAEIRDRVVYDYKVDESLKKARTVAADIVKQINAGQPFAQVMAAHGATKVPPKSFDFRRVDFEGKQMPPELNLAFSIAAKKARSVPVPNRGGYYIVYLDSIEQGDASGNADLMGKMRTALLQATSQEYAMQFMESVRRAVVVKRNADAIKALKASYAANGGRAGS